MKLILKSVIGLATGHDNVTIVTGLATGHGNGTSVTGLAIDYGNVNHSLYTKSGFS